MPCSHVRSASEATVTAQAGSKGCADMGKKDVLVGAPCLGSSASSVHNSAGSLCPPTTSAWPRNHLRIILFHSVK